MRPPSLRHDGHDALEQPSQSTEHTPFGDIWPAAEHGA
jgi:hypothetical protein